MLITVTGLNDQGLNNNNDKKKPLTLLVVEIC